MNDAFRDLADAMQTEPTDWQWIGPHQSQRMFGITRTRAEAYAVRHGGTAAPLPNRTRPAGTVAPPVHTCPKGHSMSYVPQQGYACNVCEYCEAV